MSNSPTTGLLQFDLSISTGRDLYQKALQALGPEAKRDHAFEEFSPPPAVTGLLRFNLDDPDGKMAHRRSAKALELALALFNIDEELRKRVNAELITDEEREAFESFAKFFDTNLEDLGIFIEDILS